MLGDQSFRCKIQSIYAEFIAHDALQKDRLDRYRNIEPESALFLAMQIRLQQSKRILEIGTSTGYSTLWLAEAAQSTQGSVETVEIDHSRIEIAKHYAESCNLSNLIAFHQADALNFLSAQVAAKHVYDFILLDAERSAYVDYWGYLANLINHSGAVLIVDNVLSHADEVQAFIQRVEVDRRFMMTTLNIGAGLLMIVSAE